ncbi:MAG: UDP-N-acetylmuramoyl-tripeptide--D-alanyl-D-alanine ligase [Acidimicrobiales bacterium]|nr:UDP-N-acetylmuramoyl-tripeptide--D-alanyl-D-alanine ligase [Acidimicrobiales bacterium]
MELAILGVVGLLAFCVSSIRYIRIAQREHYLAGSVTRFASRWMKLSLSPLLWVVSFGLAVGTLFLAPLALGAFALSDTVPIGLSYRGSSGKLKWTRRLKTLFGLEVTLIVAIYLLVLLIFGSNLALLTIALCNVFGFLICDLSLLISEPIEQFVGRKYINNAAKKLKEINPQIVAITGSYGKTSTKNAVSSLLSGLKATVASPASFNNKYGLSRTVLDYLLPSTEVLVAEMGTYKPGEIKDLTKWMPPMVAAITAIGPVHLERMKSEDNILLAKSEIFLKDTVAVLTVDDQRLKNLANEIEGRGNRVIRVSTSPDPNEPCDIRIVQENSSLKIFYNGELLGEGPDISDILPISNFAVAMGICVGLGVSIESLLDNVNKIAPVEHRSNVSTADSGIVVVDDTYNANPASVQLSLEKGEKLVSPKGRLVVVTPGMVELGVRQDLENEIFGQKIKDKNAELVVVGKTNRSALKKGYGGAIEVANRPDAVKWVRSNLSNGDVVCYINDLPDHFP